MEFTRKITTHLKRILLSILAFLGFSNTQSCPKSDIEKEPKKIHANEIVCMYGVPPRMYKPIQPDTTQQQAPDTTSKKQENGEGAQPTSSD